MKNLLPYQVDILIEAIEFLEKKVYMDYLDQKEIYERLNNTKSKYDFITKSSIDFKNAKNFLREVEELSRILKDGF